MSNAYLCIMIPEWFAWRRLSVAALMALMAIVAWGRSGGRVKFPGGKCYMFRVVFTDKHGTPFSPEHPEQFLSQRAIERRNRQHLAVDSTDLAHSPQYVSEVEAVGVEVICRSKWNNSLLVKGKRMDVLRSLTKLPFVKQAQCVWTSPDSLERRHDRERYITAFRAWDEVKTQENATKQQLEMLGADRVHQHGYRGRGMMIAVLDGGFMNADVIPSLQKVRVAGSVDFVFPRAESIFKEIDHGTKVLSTMAADEPELFTGSAPEATYWLLRCEDTQTETMAEEDYWAAAVEFADSAGVDVINSSLGYHDFDHNIFYKYAQLDGQSVMISRTASMLAQKGIILVNSAGNDGMGTWKKISFPADAKDILTVGAVSADKRNAAFSAVGPSADGRVKPDIMAMGSPASVITGRGSISRDIGTSFSAPIVAGMVACLWQSLPEKTSFEIMELVRRSGDNAACPDNIYGYGVPDFWVAFKNARKENGVKAE